MNLLETFQMAVKNILSSKVRTLLTMLGIIIGVAAVIIITSLGNGMQKQLYLPEPHNDFIFAVICEQLGQVFGVLLLAVYVLLILRGVTVVARARRSFEMLLGCGVLAMLGIQTFMIVAGVIKMIPLTGVTMPFLSYGGSSLLSCMAMIGILHGASARAQENLEEDILCVKG